MLYYLFAGMAELVDALRSGRSSRERVGVQVSLPALQKISISGIFHKGRIQGESYVEPATFFLGRWDNYMWRHLDVSSQWKDT